MALGLIHKGVLLSFLAFFSFILSGCQSGESSVEIVKESVIQEQTPLPKKLHNKKIVKISKFIRENKTLTANTYWLLDGLVVVRSGVVLTIEPGTTIAGMDGTGRDTSYMIVENGAKIFAEGTESKPIVFTSQKALFGGRPAPGQWGGLTIFGDAANAQVDSYEAHNAFYAGRENLEDSSGVLRHVKILNSGIAMEKDKEINGLSLLGVGSKTVIDNITIDYSGDDGIEIWGGTVNLSNIFITRCEDDYFDVDDGYSGTVKNLQITTTIGNAAIEMSGKTYPSFDGFTIVQNGSSKEGGIYFKKDGVGGRFMNGEIFDNVDDNYGAIHSQSSDKVSNTVDTRTTFINVTLKGSAKGKRVTGTSSEALGAKFRSKA